MKKTWMKHFFSLVFVVCIAVAAFLGWKLYQKQMEYQAGRESLNEVYQILAEAKPEVKVEPEAGVDVDMAVLQKLARYGVLHDENEDMTGWVRIEGTVVDYPVMHTPEEPDYYLYRSFQKENSAYGSIYLDGTCRLDGTSPNLLLYGHHMRNGDMFASLENYDAPAYWKEHPVVEFDTLEETGRYEVIGAFKRSASQVDEAFMKMLRAETEEDYAALMEFVKGYRFYDTGITAQWPQQLITLATCEYTQGDGRFFVVAKKVADGT